MCYKNMAGEWEMKLPDLEKRYIILCLFWKKKILLLLFWITTNWWIRMKTTKKFVTNMRERSPVRPTSFLHRGSKVISSEEEIIDPQRHLAKIWTKL